tara:strand:- start:145 stop:672 length:528 start_codon:yes stop_codon:yes gene_type:complete
MKRGQMLGMPFVYILMVIAMGLILLFGFNSITKILHTKDVTQISNLVLDIRDDVEVVYNYDVGSAKKFKSKNLPKSTTHICFLNPFNPLTISETTLDTWDEQIHSFLSISNRENLFFLPTQEYGPPYPDYFVDRFKLKNTQSNPFCVLTSNLAVEIIFESYLEEGQIYVTAKLPQ